MRFRVALAADDPNAKPYKQTVAVSPGAIALWEMRGPGEAADRKIAKLDAEPSMVHVGWLIWASLGFPNEEYETFLPRLLGLEPLDEVKPNPKALSTK